MRCWRCRPSGSPRDRRGGTRRASALRRSRRARRGGRRRDSYAALCSCVPPAPSKVPARTRLCVPLTQSLWARNWNFASSRWPLTTLIVAKRASVSTPLRPDCSVMVMVAPWEGEPNVRTRPSPNLPARTDASARSRIRGGNVRVRHRETCIRPGKLAVQAARRTLDGSWLMLAGTASARDCSVRSRSRGLRGTTRGVHAGEGEEVDHAEFAGDRAVARRQRRCPARPRVEI